MQYAPIALFVYDRPEHVRQTVNALRENHLARESELFIFSDAAKDKEAQDGVSKVREYVKTITGFKSIKIFERDYNVGLSRSIIGGVSELINRYGRVVVLEDDIVTSPYFLKFMNDGLSTYRNEEKVISICGYMYPIRERHTDTLFLRMIDSWGWATWKRGWDIFESDASKLLERINARRMLKRFNLDGAYSFSKVLRKQAENKISSWAICWYASAILNDKLSLYPAMSLVRNIGLTRGTHCNYSVEYDTAVSQKEVIVSNMPVEEDEHAIKGVMNFFMLNKFKKLGYFIRNMPAPRFKMERSI